MVTEEIEIVATKHSRTRKCKAKAYGPVQFSYKPDQIYWVYRGEDEYGIPELEKKGKPFCVVYIENWNKGKEQ